MAAALKVKVGSIFKVGDAVEGFSEDDNQWYPGKVKKDLGEGAFTIAWDEDGTEYDCNAGRIRRKISEVDANGDFMPGEAVEALLADDGKWYPGIIQAANADGTFKVRWDDDSGDYDASPKDMKKVVPKIEMDQIVVGQKYSGTVKTWRDNLGAFVDFGAVKDGLVHFSRIPTPEVEPGKFEVGDRVDALFNDEMQWYPATIEKTTNDGKFILKWDEGEEPYTCSAADMKPRPKMPKEGDRVDVWVTQVTPEGRIGLSMIEGGGPARGGGRQPADLSKFEGLDPTEWHDGVIKRVMPFGFFVEVTAPSGDKAQGLVHVSRIRDGFVENTANEGSEGQEVKVRVEGVKDNKLSLSMKSPSVTPDGNEGGGGGRQPADLSKFEGLDPTEWHDGVIKKVMRFGFFVEVTAPSGAKAQGLVHVSRIRDGFVENAEDEGSEGQEVKVRVEGVTDNKLSLSMKSP